MRPPRHTSLRARLVLGGTILAALAALTLWVGALDSGQPRGRHEVPVAPPPQASAPVASERSAALEPAHAARTRRESGPDTAVADGMTALVEDATSQLVRTLELPEFVQDAWQAEVRSRAAGLGNEALPALEAIVGDEQRSDEEHIAASELVAVLRAR